ncbi:MAG: hypothetical protein ACHQET_06085 [Chitinophagales bacterium]
MSKASAPNPMSSIQQENDSMVWRTATRFCNLFSGGDAIAMQKELPEDFLLQWMHENFIGKKNLVSAMKDSATRNVMSFRIRIDNSTIIRYSDDQSAAGINTSFEFIDPANCKALEDKHGCGLCIFYLKKDRGRWVIKTIHIDVHCSLCDL